MELTFEKVGNQYVAEFQAPSDFNLHIEREEIGVLEVHQRGSEEGKYDFAWGTGVNGRKVVDYDFGALVYPKWIKVVSGSEVVNASVNFNEGGGSGSGSSDGAKWEYYKIERNTSYDDDAMSNVFSHVTLVNQKSGGTVYIVPRGRGWDMTAAIAGISVKKIVGESVVDTGSWLSDVKECDKLLGNNYDYSFLIPITKEEFYSNNFDYPVPEEG